MAKHRRRLTTSHVPAIGGAIAKGLQQDPYWKPFFDGFPPVREWLARGEARRRRGVLQRPRPELLPRQDADLRGRRGARVPQRRRGLGHPAAAAVQGRPGPVLAPDRVAGRRGVRPHHLPGDAGRPRLHAADGAALAATRTGRCASCRSCINTVQFPLPSAARCYKLGQAIGRGDRSPGTRTSGWWCSAPAACRTSSTASAPASSTRSSTCSSWTA